MMSHSKAMSFGPQIITGSPLLAGEVGFSYAVGLNAINGAAPYTYSVTSGVLPPGLSIAGPAIVGTPTTANPYAFSLMATDSKGAKSNAAAFSLTIVPMLAITTASPLPAGTQGTAYSTTLVASGGVSPYSWALVAGSLDSGLSLNTATGVISGTPANAETDTPTFQVTDSLNYEIQKTFSLTVSTAAATPTFSPPAGSYSNAQSVAISCSTPSSTIYYTTNGTTPTTSSPVYSSPVVVSATETVQAIATAPGFTQSSVGSASYTIGSVMAPAQQLKFANGHWLMTENYESGTNTGSGGPTQQSSEVALLKASPIMIGYLVCMTARNIEDYTQATNLALTQAAGATGAALQTAINTQYPGFATWEKWFYYQQSQVNGSYNALIINFVISNGPGAVTGAFNFSSSCVVPNDVRDCGGSITVPNSYGSTQTTAYQVAPIYSGSVYYGFGFANSNGTTFAITLPAYWNPGVNQRQRAQLWQAFYQRTMTYGPAYSNATAYTPGQWVTGSDTNSYVCIANTTGNAPPNATYWILNRWAGKTPEQIPEYGYSKTNDEVTWDCRTGVSSGPTVTPPNQGATPYAASAANFWGNHAANIIAIRAAGPTTPYGDCISYGFSGSDGFQTIANMQAVVNHLFPGNAANGLSRIRGWVLSDADMMPNNFELGAPANGWTNPYGIWSYTGALGISTGDQWSTSGLPYYASQMPIDPTYGLPGKIGWDGEVQTGDFNYVPTGSSGITARTQSIIAPIIDNARYAGCHMMTWSPTDSTFSGSVWASYIYPGIVASLGAHPLSTLLPLYWMYGPAITSVVTVSSSSLTVNWPAITGQGTGLSILLYRNGVQVASGAAASFTSYTDTGLMANTTYSYTLAMQNANGTGPQGAAVPANLPVFAYPSGFAGSSGQINVVPNYGGLVGSTIVLIRAASGHSYGGAWYATKVSFAAGFTSNFSFRITGSGQTAGGLSTIAGLTFVLQNDPRGPSIGGDANSCGYGAFEQFAGNIPIANSIGVKFDIGTAAYYTNPPTGYSNSTGLYTNGGFADQLVPQQDLNPYAININAGNIIAGQIVYDLSILTLTLKDTVTNAQARYSWPVTISTFTGATTAYVGFGAGQVANTEIDLLSWDYTAGYNIRLATPTFSVPGGQYAAPQNVVLFGPAGASIYYTINGLEPTAAATLYSAPIAVSANRILKAIAIQAGYTDSFVATANYLIQSSGPTVNFSSGFAGYAGLLNLIGRTALSGSALQLTDGTNPPSQGEVGGIWYAAPVTVSGPWSTNFQFNLNAGNARGIAFVLQNQPPASAGTSVVGVTGGPFAIASGAASMGFGANPTTNQGGALTPAQIYGLANSVAVIFAPINGSGSYTGLYTNGTSIPSTSDGISRAMTGGINLQSGHSMNATLSYNGTVLSLTVTDATNGTLTYSTNWTVNIVSVVGANTATAGFTGGDYGGAAQQINNWTGF